MNQYSSDTKLFIWKREKKASLYVLPPLNRSFVLLQFVSSPMAHWLLCFPSMTFDAGTGLVHFGHEKSAKLADHFFLVYDQRIILFNIKLVKLPVQAAALLHRFCCTHRALAHCAVRFWWSLINDVMISDSISLSQAVHIHVASMGDTAVPRTRPFDSKQTRRQPVSMGVLCILDFFFFFLHPFYGVPLISVLGQHGRVER